MKNRSHRQVPSRRPFSEPIILFASLTVLVILVYGRMVFHDFVDIDDNVYVMENSRVLSGLTLDGIRWAAASLEAEFWHPLTWLSLMLDSTIYGANAGGFLLTNLLLHLANTLLLMTFLWRTTHSPWPSAVVAALFALHPLHVESVAWVAQRKDLLSTLFGMLALIAYHDWWRRRGPGRYGLVMVCFACALMAKPLWVTLPFVLMLLHIWPMASANDDAPPQSLWQRLRPQWHLYLPMLVMTAAACVLAIAAQPTAQESTPVAMEYWALRLPSVPLAYLTYLRATLWPTDLTFFYPFPSHLSITAAVTAALLLIALSALALNQKRTRPWVTVGWFWFVGVLIPMSGIIKIGDFSTADRYTYVPLIGLFIAVVWTAWSGVRKKRQPQIAVAAALVILACAVGAWRQVGVWKNPETLARHALDISRTNYLAHNVLGLYQLRQRHLEEAESSFKETVRIRPSYASGYVNLALVYKEQGRPQDVSKAYRAALREDPKQSQAHAGLGRLMLEHGRPGDAVAHFQRAIDAMPAMAVYHLMKGDALIKAGDPKAATAPLNQAVTLEPKNADARIGLGRALDALGQSEDAEMEFSTAISLDPSHPEGYFYFGNFHLSRGRGAEAIPLYQTAVKLSPTRPRFLNNLAMAHARSGNLPEAITALERLAVIDRKTPFPCYNLAALNTRTGQLDKALDWLSRAFSRGFSDCGKLFADDDFKPLRGTPKFEVLTTRHCQ